MHDAIRASNLDPLPTVWVARRLGHHLRRVRKEPCRFIAEAFFRIPLRGLYRCLQAVGDAPVALGGGARDMQRHVGRAVTEPELHLAHGGAGLGAECGGGLAWVVPVQVRLPNAWRAFVNPNGPWRRRARLGLRLGREAMERAVRQLGSVTVYLGFPAGFETGDPDGAAHERLTVSPYMGPQVTSGQQRPPLRFLSHG